MIRNRLAAAAAALLLPLSANAQEGSLAVTTQAANSILERMSSHTVDLTYGISLQSDANSLALSQTEGKPGAFAFAQLNYGSFLAGASWFNTDFGPANPASGEFDWYFGIDHDFRKVNVKLIADYIDLTPIDDYNYWEYLASVGYEASPSTSFTANYMWAPNADNLNYHYGIFYLTALHALTERWSLSGTVGHRNISDGVFDDYNFVDVGVGYALTPKLTLELHYKDMDVDKSICDAACAGKFYVSLNYVGFIKGIFR